MDIAGFSAQAQLALCDTGEIEQIVNQARFEGDIAFHHSQVFARVNGETLVLREGAGHHQHRRQRRAQFVGKRSEKGVLRLAGGFRPALGRFKIVNVGISSKPLHNKATCIARGLRADKKPAISSIMPPKTKLDFVASTAGERSLPLGQCDRQVVGMNELRPGITENLSPEVGFKIFDAFLVSPVQRTIGTCRPDLKRNNFSEKMETVRGV